MESENKKKVESVSVTIETDHFMKPSTITVRNIEGAVAFKVTDLEHEIVINGENRIDNFIRMIVESRNQYLSMGKVIPMNGQEFRLCFEKPLKYIQENQVEFGVDFVEIGELVEEMGLWKSRNPFDDRMTIDEDFVIRVSEMICGIYNEYKECVSDCIEYSSVILKNILERK